MHTCYCSAQHKDNYLCAKDDMKQINKLLEKKDFPLKCDLLIEGNSSGDYIAT